MKLDEEILLNKFGQDLVEIEQIIHNFMGIDRSQKRNFLNDLVHLIIQSKPQNSDIEMAIKHSGLKSTHTPCVLLRKGVAPHQLFKILELPDAEVSKSLVVLLSLFKVAYNRRFEIERGNPNKWWYWDLSDITKLEMIPGKSRIN